MSDKLKNKKPEGRLLNRAAFRREVKRRWEGLGRNGTVQLTEEFLDTLEARLKTRVGRLIASGSRRRYTAADAAHYF